MPRTLDHPDKENHAKQNLIDTSILVAASVAILGLAAWSIAGMGGLAVAAFVLSAALLLDPEVPAPFVMRLYGAELQPVNESQISSLVDVLAWRAGLGTRPAFYVIPSLTLNAFSTGTTSAPAIAITEGLLRRLSLRETAAVIAHEMSHIKNGDLEVYKFADALARLSQLVAYLAVVVALFNIVLGLSGDEPFAWPLVALLYCAPLASNFLQERMSRARDYDADREAVALTGDASSFISALRRLDSYGAATRGTILEDLLPPVPGRRIADPSLLRSPPPTADRIAQIESLNPTSEFEPLVITEQPRVSLVGYGPGDMRPRIHWTGLWY
jgi:heat shock protein HtpX